ncbi:choloylglycine hydrolase [Bacteroidales bacterium]|nr:choloylglycine hydrolase [Bacteroidales bacterium]
MTTFLKKSLLLSVVLFGASLADSSQLEACTRAVYLGPNNTVITGRSMDWKEDIKSNIYVFPRAMDRKGMQTGNTLSWTSKYGSIIATAYDIGSSDGMNEKGLVANMLYLSESTYTRENDSRPMLSIGAWAQYILDNFATVSEAVAELRKDNFQIHSVIAPNGAASTVHVSISDPTGNSAIFEYFNGNIVIHEGREFQVMTNSPKYDEQLALNQYWKQLGGTVMLPGTNRAADRFARASFYINATQQTDKEQESVASVFSVIRNCSVPLGISTPGEPNISSTVWRTVSDHKNMTYYFESTLSPTVFWFKLSKLDFKKGAPVKKLELTNGQIYSGEATAMLKNSVPFKFAE